MKTTIVTRTFAALAAVGALFAAMMMLAGGASAKTNAPGPGGGVGGVHISNPHPQAGADVTVSGQGCTPGAQVTVALDGSPIGSGTTDSNGAYSITVTIPAGTSPGSHTISVTGGNCAGSGVLGIEVVAPASTSGGGGSLASTGVAVVGIGALGVVLLVGGAMMLMAGRRRSHA